jgi:hypothetical protein
MTARPSLPEIVAKSIPRLAPPRRSSLDRDELLAKYPAEFRHGYLSGYTGENQPPCDAAGYMIGHHTWPLERKNAWFAGWNLGNCEAPK